jgi:hypothetical protein
MTVVSVIASFAVPPSAYNRHAVVHSTLQDPKVSRSAGPNRSTRSGSVAAFAANQPIDYDAPGNPAPPTKELT